MPSDLRKRVMMDVMEPINDLYLPGNMCFGCGLANPDGLQVKLFRDPVHQDRIIGSFTPRESLAGFPSIVHGGIQFTALDCVAGWATLVLRAPEGHMPLTTKASMSFRKPVMVGREITLAGEITGETVNGGWTIATSISDETGQLSTAEFEYVAVPVDKFHAITGTTDLPHAWQHRFAM